MRFLLLTIALLGASAITFAQDPADIFHKTVNLDSFNTVSFEVYKDDQLEFRTWPGDDILIETSVKINNGESFVLDFFKKQQRWDLKLKPNGSDLLLSSRNKTRKMVKGADESLTSETVVIVIYMPEDFTDTGGNKYQRKGK